VRLAEEDLARIGWRPRNPPPPQHPFDFEEFLGLVESWCRVHRTGWEREVVAHVIPARLSKKEAWLWLHCLDTPREERHRLGEKLRAAHAADVPEDAQVRVFAKEIAQRSKHAWFGHDVPQALQPFFTPAEIAELIISQVQARGGYYAAHGPWPMLEFAAFIVPVLDEQQRASLRSTLEEAYDAEPDRSTPRAQLRLALLCTVGAGARLTTHLATLPDGAWAGPAWNHLWFVWRAGHLDMLAGLPDEASFVREARRLGCRPHGTSDLRLWLAATEWRELDIARDAVIAAQNKDEAAAMARVLALVEAPEAAVPMLAVQLRSRAPAVAAQWLAGHPLHVAIGLTSTAMGQGTLAEAAREHLHTMRRTGHTPVLTAALRHLQPLEAEWLQREILGVHEEPLPEIRRAELPEALSRALGRVKARKPPDWLTPTLLPPIPMQDGRLATADVTTLLAALGERPVGASTGPGAALLTVLKEHVKAASLDTFAWKLFDLWLTMGAPSKDKWAMWGLGALGADSCVLKLTPLLREWPGAGQNARAVFGLACLRAVGSDTALLALNGIAQNLKFKRLKATAQEMMEGIAHARGLSSEQLSDRIVPDCGLDAHGSRVFDFGPRQFRFVLGPDMKPLVRDATGKVRADLPAPGRADDSDKAAATVAEWRHLKKTLRAVLKVQAERLEGAMISGRRWTPAEFQTLLVQHPLMINLARLLVLGVYDTAGKVTATFRITEDRKLADQHDEETTLPTVGQIGIVHPAHLDDAQKSAWGQVLGDYKIIPPFPQLGRDICSPDTEDLDRTQITRFAGPKIPGIVLYGMLERAHWLHDEPADGGGFMQHSRHYPAAQVTAFIRYSPGLSIAWYEAPQELQSIYFVPGHVKPTYWGEHKDRLRIREVEPLVLSEVLRLAHALVSAAT
jgi:hypothetical protein